MSFPSSSRWRLLLVDLQHTYLQRDWPRCLKQDVLATVPLFSHSRPQGAFQYLPLQYINGPSRASFGGA